MGTPRTRSVPYCCSVRTASAPAVERNRRPPTSPPQASTDCTRATDRALPCPPAAGISARRHAGSHDCSAESGAMGEQVPDLDALLAARFELGPVPGHRGVELDLAAVGQQEYGQRRHRLGRRPDVGDRVALPRLLAGLVLGAGPDVDDRLAV